MARGTNVGVAMDKDPAYKKFFLFDYCKTKYEGLPEKEIRRILHPYYQLKMQSGRHN